MSDTPQQPNTATPYSAPQTPTSSPSKHQEPLPQAAAQIAHAAALIAMNSQATHSKPVAESVIPGASSAPPSEYINIRVKHQEGAEIFFRVKPTTLLKKLFENFCTRQGLKMNAVRFMFDGTRLEEQKTPGDYGMEDQDVIDVMSSQVGGYQQQWW